MKIITKQYNKNLKKLYIYIYICRNSMELSSKFDKIALRLERISRNMGRLSGSESKTFCHLTPLLTSLFHWFLPDIIALYMSILYPSCLALLCFSYSFFSQIEKKQKQQFSEEIKWNKHYWSRNMFCTYVLSYWWRDCLCLMNYFGVNI